MRMQAVKGFTKSHFIYIIPLVFLIIYVSLRAAFVNITHDEAYSFHNAKHFWYAEFLCTGNSHWPNSLAIKMAILLGGENLLAIRWLSIVSFIGICICVFQYVKTLDTPILKMAALCFILFDPYLLDYFTIARGYASGMLFESLSLLLFFKGIRVQKHKFMLWAFIFSGISAICNYSFIYFFCGFWAVYFYKNYFQARISYFKRPVFYFEFLYGCVILMVIALAFRFIMKCSHDVVGAGSETLNSLFYVFIDGNIYYKFPISHAALLAVTILFMLFFLWVLLVGVFQFKKHNNTVYHYVSLMLSVMFGLMITNKLLFDVVYPFYRACMFLFIPVSICIVSYFQFLYSKFEMFKYAIIGACLILTINFLLSLNLKFTFDFKEQADAELCFDYIQDTGAKQVGLSPELYGAYANYYGRSTAYHYTFIAERMETWEPKGLCPIPNKLQDYEYMVLFYPYNLNYYKNSDVRLEGLYLSPVTKTVILRIKKP